jgi:hypothetical protein
MASGTPHTAKSTTTKTNKKRLRKGGRNERKYARYRARVGKPNGPGMPGNKSGKNKIHS